VERVHPEIEWIPLDSLPEATTFRGPDGMREFWRLWQETFEAFHAEPEEYVEAGDAVVVITHIEGRGRDSGAAVHTPGFPIVWTTRDEVLVRVEMFDSREKALESVGLPPDTPFEQFAS
jgi:ketosteroid isomerase-like protein